MKMVCGHTQPQKMRPKIIVNNIIPTTPKMVAIAKR